LGELTHDWHQFTNELKFRSLRDIYGYESAVGQHRLLADLLLMIGDHESAASSYRHAVDAYKNERAWRHMAAACEMAAVCQMAQPSKNRSSRDSSFDAMLDTAYHSHLRAADASGAPAPPTPSSASSIVTAGSSGFGGTSAVGNEAIVSRLYALRSVVLALLLSGLPGSTQEAWNRQDGSKYVFFFFGAKGFLFFGSILCFTFPFASHTLTNDLISFILFPSSGL
jgi:hypothetical protein